MTISLWKIIKQNMYLRNTPNQNTINKRLADIQRKIPQAESPA